MYRTWTTLINRIECSQDFEGYVYICLDASGFSGGDYGWFYFSKLQLTDASLNDEYYDLDYLTQLKEKRIELADTSYYKNLIGVDGIVMDNGHIKSDFDFSGNSYELNENGFKYDVGIADGHLFTGMSKSYYSYDGGSSGMINGYDDIFGFGCSRPIGGNREGIFIGVHEGFQVANATEYGRADIYSYKKYDGITAWDEWTDWELLGQRIEPQGLVRRDGNCNIATNDTIYFTATPKMDVNGVQGYIVVNGTQYGNHQLNLYTGSNIEIWADSDCSTTTERVWLGAGKNAITITSNGQNTSSTGLKYNSQEIIHGGNREATGMVYGTSQSGCTNVANLNNIWRSGFYDGHNLSNAPENNTGWFWVVNASHMSNSTGYKYGLQIAGLNVQGNAVWMRCTNEKGEGTWYRYYNTGYQQTSTSDIRYKRAIADVDTSDCYTMVKNTQLHHYLLLDDTDELRACSEDGIDELETELDSDGYSRKIQMGIIAQDVLKYECGKYFVVQDVDRDDDGNIKSDKYSIDAYNYASAILGGLQEEIKVRDAQYEELKKENEDLKNRLDRLEQLILKGE